VFAVPKVAREHGVWIEGSPVSEKIEVGTRFRHVLGDQNALWEVVEIRDDIAIAEILNEPIECDGVLEDDDLAGTQRPFFVSEIRSARHIAAVFGATDADYEPQTLKIR
jgi:hypothetical protein